MFQAVLTSPPSAPSSSCISGMFQAHIDKPEIDKEEATFFAKFYKLVLKLGGFIFILVEFYMIEAWIVLFSKCGFLVVSCLYAFVYNAETVPRKKH